MLDRLEFLIGEALVSLRRNSWMTFASIITSTLALIILGGFTLAYIGIASYVASQESKFELSVFARDDANPDQVQNLGNNIKKLPGVKDVSFKSKNEVWAEWKAKKPALVQGFELENPMPDTFIVTFTDLEKVNEVERVIKSMPEVAPLDGVQKLGEVQTLLQQIMAIIRGLGIVLGIVTLLTGGILIYNTVRLTMIARRREIRIMQLVGATKETVHIPLLIEGATQGVAGAILATIVLGLGYGLVARLLSDFLKLPLSVFPLLPTLFALTLTGAIYGLICSTLAIRERSNEGVPR
jgi:cell division transport system permease protein